MKYNLTFWKRLELIPVWFMWVTTPKEERRTWHEIKKGEEKHKHNYVIPLRECGMLLYKCDHEGCQMAIPDPAEEAAREARFNEMMERYKTVPESAKYGH